MPRTCARRSLPTRPPAACRRWSRAFRSQYQRAAAAAGERGRQEGSYPGGSRSTARIPAERAADAGEDCAGGSDRRGLVRQHRACRGPAHVAHYLPGHRPPAGAGQGRSDLNTNVPLQRPVNAGDKKVLTREEAAARREFLRNALQMLVKIAPVEAIGVDWFDNTVHAEDLRTSLITYPATGRLPALVKGVQISIPTCRCSGR